MNLVDFSKADIDGNIEITEEINFQDNYWKLQYAQSEHVCFNYEKVLYNGGISDCRDLIILIKMLTYYEFPKLFNLNITSWLTTASRHACFANAAKLFLFEHGFTSRGMLSNITLVQCQEYIVRCIELRKNNVPGAVHQLHSAVYFFDRWAELTKSNKLPAELKLEYDKHAIVNKEQRSEIRTLRDEMCDPWQPLEADIVKPVFDESVRYIRSFAPTIIECNDLIRKKGRHADGSPWGCIRKDGRTKKIFETLLKMPTPEISAGVKLFNFHPIKRKVISLGYTRGWQYRTTISISEVRPSLIKLKRCCIFIIGLFTGLRRREIAELLAKPAYIKNGTTYLDIVRFKTATDSESEGEPDSIPVPNIVADAIDVLIELFAHTRRALNSQYLLTTDIHTKKNYEKIKVNTISKDVQALVTEITGVTDASPHQLRKTIAWLLISRSELNVELIRQLFGHKSFGMTLRYIMRNELIVANVVELLEHNYTEDLKDIFEAISNNKTSGDLSEKIKKRMEEQNYSGQILVTDIESYVRESLKAGVPLYVSRVPIGGFCLKTSDEDTLPPCMMKTGTKTPCVEFCNYKKCNHLVFSEESVANIHSQIRYYEQKLGYLGEFSNETVVAHYENEILEHKELLEQLENQGVESRNQETHKEIV